MEIILLIHFEYKMKCCSEFHSCNQGPFLILFWRLALSNLLWTCTKHNITRNMLLFTGPFPFCRNCGCRKPHQTIQFGIKSQITRFCILRLDGHSSKQISQNNICGDWLGYLCKTNVNKTNSVKMKQSKYLSIEWLQTPIITHLSLT